MKTALIIFVKNPELGKVKTRLAQTMGEEAALNIYTQLLEHTSKITQECKAQGLVFFSSTLPIEDPLWPKNHFQYHLQEEGNLGDRIKAAFQIAFENHEKVLIIGSDCPGINPTIIHQADLALNQHDAVIGPAKDGGYYLLGLKKFHPSLVENIAWSQASVFEQTVSAMDQLQWTYQTLEVLSDVDYEEDWEALKYLL